MKRCLARLSAVLPFLPMALGSFDNLLEKSSKPNPPPEFKGPFFISPKHDGIRLVSCPGIVDSYTCFSRFGKPVFGLHWVEDELRHLRRLSMDPNLCVDGELYLHDTDSTVGTASGFQLVNGLVNRVRGRKTVTTTNDALEHCPVLPQFCVFDLVQYQPPVELSAAIQKLSKQEQLLVGNCMKLGGLGDLRTLAVKPNETGFLQRLRTLNFLFNLLAASAAAKQRDKPLEMTATPKPHKFSTLQYKGGKSVQLIPYRMIPSLLTAREEMKTFVHTGYEGLVARTASNVYQCAWKNVKQSSKGGKKKEIVLSESKTVAGCRSESAVKLLPVVEDEFLVSDIVVDKKSGLVTMLECLTTAGAHFRVSLPTSFDQETKKSLVQQLNEARKKNRLVGVFVTLQFPSLQPSGIPRFPKVKGIRGGKGWFI